MRRVTGLLSDDFEQSGRCRLEWGHRGARRAAARGDALVIVDTLSFSSAVVTAIHRGALIYPCAPDDDAAALARATGAERAVHRRAVPGAGRFSLSPTSFFDVEPGTRVVLPSPNGGTCSRHGQKVPLLVVGTLLNAGAVAFLVDHWLSTTEGTVTVLCCGERWRERDDEGELRVAIEDYLGAGAILAALSHTKSPEARVCEAAFRGVREELAAVIWECDSGRELRDAGFADDVRYVAQLDVIESVPVWEDGALRRAGREG